MNDGSWSDVFAWPIIGIHAVLTPDGNVLTFGTDRYGQQGGQHIFDVWNIATNTHYTINHGVTTDIFCSAAIIVPETGEILISGGDSRPLGHVNHGVSDVNVFDYQTMTLTSSATGDMNFARWYPTALTLANGKILMLGGLDGAGQGVATPEVFTPGVGWNALGGAKSTSLASHWNYPRSWLASDGRVVVITQDPVAPQSDVLVMDPSGKGTVVSIGKTPFQASPLSPSIMYDEDKVLFLTPGGEAWIVDISGPAPTYQKTAGLGQARLWSNLTLLADGSVMVSGGSAADNQLVGVNKRVAIWDPDSGQWTFDDSAAVARLYHSTTLLLPDATVLSLGGGAPGPLTNLNGEVYKPGYLFDEAGNLAVRPQILEAPTELEQREDFTITVDNPGAISKLTLVKYGSATHSFNPESRVLELSFKIGADGKLQVDLPENANVVSPGYWMLFAFNKQGTPSVAATIHIDTGGELFSDEVGGFLTLNGAAKYNAETGVFTLTPDAPKTSGGVMANDRVDLRHDFTIDFDIFLGVRDAGADGAAFVLHNDPLGGDAMGGRGGAMGAFGIRNGLAIEFDTYDNGLARGDIARDHTQLVETDLPLGQAGQAPAFLLGNVEDGRWHSVVVTWDYETQTLRYTVDGKLAGTLAKDLAAAFFGGSEYVHFGFTGATGGLSNLQRVRINTVEATFQEDGHHEDGHECGCGLDVKLSEKASYDEATDTFTLTPDAYAMRGGVMSNERIDLKNDFKIDFEVFLGTRDAGADGLAFVIHNGPRGAAALGSGGAGLGAAGIKNGLGIEFDTYMNPAQRDLAEDHTNLFDTDAPRGSRAITSPFALGNIEDAKWHSVSVTWDHETQTLSYTFDGRQIATLSRDLADDFLGGSEFAHFGFTGATGGLANLQRVHITSIDAMFEDGTTLTASDITQHDHLA